MPTELPPNESSYVFDNESATEMMRLMLQDRLLTKGMGGLFSEQTDLSSVNDILDIGCGPGGWVLDVAYAYPKKQVVGFDIGKLVIDYARAQAKVQWLNNVSFKIMDALKPLDFADASFDLVNARFLFGVMPKVAWPKLLQECMRITRPGGIVRLTECEMPLTNSLAFEKLSGMFTRALQLSKQSFSPDGRHIGITPVLKRLLQEAGYKNVRQVAHAIDASSGTEAFESASQNFKIAFNQSQNFLLKMQVTTQEEFDALYEQMLQEMASSDFCAVWYYLTAVGEKP